MAEGLSDRFLKIDREKYGIIEGVTDHDFYTNSMHVPVYYQISIKDKIDIEAKYHHLGNGGHISYVELDGYPDKQTVKNIIDYAFNNTDMSYMGINFKEVQCKNCGKKIESSLHECQYCGSKDIQVIQRVSGYLAYIERFCEGKRHEANRRRAHGSVKNGTVKVE